MKARRTNLVTVVGAVESPGLKELSASQSDLLSALVAAGGLSKDASSIIEIRHPSDDAGLSQRAAGELELASRAAGPLADQATSLTSAHRTLRIDLENPPVNSGRDFDLRDGSVVMVMKRPEEYVHVMGLVKKADQFKFPDDQEMRLLDAIAMAGGRSMEIADKVRIIRRAGNPDAPPILIQASVREAKQDASANLRLAPGDVVSVEETPTTFVVGTIREFVRFGFTSAIPGL
jgi:polysaccharide export outer membrane protein